jgi:hypothetical protein
MSVAVGDLRSLPEFPQFGVAELDGSLLTTDRTLTRSPKLRLFNQITSFGRFRVDDCKITTQGEGKHLMAAARALKRLELMQCLVIPLVVV